MLAARHQRRSTEILKGIDAIEAAVNSAKMPVSFADQVYVVCQHIIFVRDRLMVASSPHPVLS